MKNAYRYVGAGILALALSGCAGGAIVSEPAAPAATTETTDEVTGEASDSTVTFVDGLLTYLPTKVGSGQIGLAAQFVGVISFENGCVLVDGAPFVFPREGTAWDGTTLTVHDREFVVGDQITVGGGEFSGQELPENAPDQCGGLTPVFVTGVADEG